MKRNTTLLGLVVFASLASGFSGCPTKSDADVNHQNIGAAVEIEKKAVELDAALPADAPAAVKAAVTFIAGAAKDIRQNSEVLVETVGVPEKPEPYSPEGSARFREQAQKEHLEPPGIIGFIGKALGALGWDGGATILAGVWGLWMTLRKRGTDRKLVGVYEGIQQAKKRLSEKDGSLIDVLHEGLRAGQMAWGVWQDVAPEIKRLRDAGRLSQDPERSSSAPTLGPTPPAAPAPTTPS